MWWQVWPAWIIAESRMLTTHWLITLSKVPRTGEGMFANTKSRSVRVIECEVQRPTVIFSADRTLIGVLMMSQDLERIIWVLWKNKHWIIKRQAGQWRQQWEREQIGNCRMNQPTNCQWPVAVGYQTGILAQFQEAQKAGGESVVAYDVIIKPNEALKSTNSAWQWHYNTSVKQWVWKGPIDWRSSNQ